MEKRAVQVSHELWKQIMTEGYTAGGVKCIKGLPEDAELVSVIDYAAWPKPDLLFVFESENWAGPPSDYLQRVDYHTQEVVFQTAECRTCKKFTPGRFSNMGQQSGLCSYLTVPTFQSFGCTAYEPRETND